MIDGGIHEERRQKDRDAALCLRRSERSLADDQHAKNVQKSALKQSRSLVPDYGIHVDFYIRLALARFRLVWFGDYSLARLGRPTSRLRQSLSYAAALNRLSVSVHDVLPPTLRAPGPATFPQIWLP